MAPTANTAWPTAPIELHPNLRGLITRFFEISDKSDPSSGQMFAEEVFTADGVLKMGARLSYSGSEEIAASRQAVHAVIDSREHEVSHVFAANSPATDVVVLGSVLIRLKDGSEVAGEFSGRFILAKDGERVQSVHLWSDPAAMLEAFKKAAAALAAASENARQ